MNYNLGKPYKLCSKKVIQSLFEKGDSVNSFPFSCRLLEEANDSGSPFQFVVSVPKKNFKSAVKRNRIKRLIRESLRLNKELLESKIEPNKQIALFLIYTSKEELSFEVMNRKMIKLLNKIALHL